jgi:3-polyprenyl-4-hydroxybenzoate decarboxylase
MPVVIVCGGDPMSFLMRSSEVPQGGCELDVVGDMRARPVEVIKGPVTGLIDACRPWRWRDKFPAVNMPTPEERREGLAKFGHLLST